MKLKRFVIKKTDLERKYEDMKEENKETQQRCTELERKIVHRARLVQTLKNQLEEKEAIIASNTNDNNSDIQNRNVKKYSFANDIVQTSRIEEELEQSKERISQLEDELQKSKEELAKIKRDPEDANNIIDYYNTPPTSPPVKSLDKSKQVYSLQEILELNRHFDKKNPEELTKRVYWLYECLCQCQKVMSKSSSDSIDYENIKFSAPPTSVKINDDSEKQFISNLMEERDDTLKKQHQLEKELLILQGRYDSLAKEHEELLESHNNIINQGKLNQSKKDEETSRALKLLQQKYNENNTEMNEQLEEKNIMIQKFSVMLDDKENTLNQRDREIKQKNKKINDLNKQLETIEKEKELEIENLKMTIRNLTNEKDDLLKSNRQHQAELQTVKDDLKKEQSRQRDSMSDTSSNYSFERRAGRSTSSPTSNNTQIMERISKMRSEVDAMRKKLKNKSNTEFSV